jgi:hypothetical protein
LYHLFSCSRLSDGLELSSRGCTNRRSRREVKDWGRPEVDQELVAVDSSALMPTLNNNYSPHPQVFTLLSQNALNQTRSSSSMSWPFLWPADSSNHARTRMMCPSFQFQCLVSNSHEFSAETDFDSQPQAPA